MKALVETINNKKVFKVRNSGTKRKYYKYYYETYVTPVGTPTIIENVASNFTASSYLRLFPFSPASSAIEAVVHIKTGDTIANEGIMGGIGDSEGFSPFYIYNNYWVAYLSSNGTSWNLANSRQIMPITTNTEYILKCTFNGSEYTFSSYENYANNKIWIIKNTLSSTASIYGGLTLQLGNNRGQNNPFSGEIYLDDCYIKLGSYLLWQGAKQVYTESTSSDYDFYRDVDCYKTLKSWEKGQYYGN